MFRELLKDRTGIKLGLERVISCLKYFNSPQEKFKSVLIGGTNGKGSVTFYLSNLACKFSKLKTGRYISPHLVSLSERFVINESEVDPSILNEISHETLKLVKDFEKKEGIELTEFEVLTVTAFNLFSREKVDLAFLEVGMGGRLDATNVVSAENILCSVITNISLDHTDFLGNTIEAIAFEKAGIIKNNNCVITGANEPGLSIISKQAKELNSRLIRVNTNDCRFYKDKNTKIALTAWEEIKKHIKYLEQDIDLEKYLNSLQFPGRFHFLERNKIILDGAHNPDAALELKKLIDENFSNKKIIYIIGMLDKDYKSFIKNLLHQNSYVISTEPKSERRTSSEKLLQSVLENGSDGIATQNLKNAIKIAKSKEHDLIIITGSLYLVGEALELELS